KRQTLFFSATMPAEIQKLADSILNNPVKVEVTPVSSTAETIKQSVYFVEREDKLNLLTHILKNDISDYHEDTISSSGYVLSSLEASLWCFLNSESHAEAVLKAVNLGEDTDTTGAITGGIAGIYYGFENIPQEWISVLARKEDIENLCIKLETQLMK
ncbi:MAG: hypothetical protein DI622_07980, partial [Chryseobacterium sp.]